MQLILPQELYDVVWKDVEAKISNIHYSRVIMSLSEILERDFFNTYIKTGTSSLLLCPYKSVEYYAQYQEDVLNSSALYRQHLDVF